MHVFVTLSPCAYGLQETLVSLENTMKIHLDKTLYFFDDSPHSIFQLYFRCLLFYYPFYIVLTRCHKIGNVYTVFTQVSAQGAHLILSSQRGGTFSREVLFRGRHSLNISKRHQNTLNLSLESNNKKSNNNRRMKCIMFKTVCKTPLFTKEKLQYKLN